MLSNYFSFPCDYLVAVVTIPEERLRKAVERNDGVYISDEMEDAADFAARLLVVEPLWEKAKEVLRKHGQREVSVGNYICICCDRLIGLGCAPSCAIAELLREE